MTYIISAEREEYLAVGRAIINRCMADEPIPDIQEWLRKTIDRMEGLGAAPSGMLAWEDTFDFYDGILAKREEYANLPEDQRKELTWPWATWNAKIDPPAPGFLVVISAGDGQGKTMYSEVIAEDWAKKRNRVVYVHFELNHSVMMDRRYVRHTGVLMRDLRSGRLTKDQSARVNQVHAKLREWEGNITYQHSAGWSMEQTVDRLRQLKAEDKCDAVIIDYLEKSAPSSAQQKLFGTNHFQREADNVERLKNFAENTETPIVMLAQMNKNSKADSSGRVDRTGIRGAGEKTEKANIVILLNREWDEIRESYSAEVDIRVDKNTLGPTCAFKQIMIPEYFRIHDMVQEVALNGAHR